MKKLSILLVCTCISFFGIAQNVGIGTTNPNLAGLVVNKGVGATYGIFGGATTGISLQGGWPAIGFNEYYNGNVKFMNAGFAGQLLLNPSDGHFTLSCSNATGTAGGTATLTDVLSMYRDGGMLVNGPNASYNFRDRTLTNYGGWNWYANNGVAHLYSFSGGDIINATNSGNVGIGIAIPTDKLHVNGSARITGNTSIEGALQVQSIATFADNVNINGTLTVGKGVTMPYKAIYDNYTVTDDDYSVQFTTTSATGVYKTLYLPTAVGKAGRIYVISIDIPHYTETLVSLGGCYCASSLTIMDLGSNTNVITTSNLADIYGNNNNNKLMYNSKHYTSVSYTEYYKKTTVTVQSNGAVWKVISNDFVETFSPY